MGLRLGWVASIGGLVIWFSLLGIRPALATDHQEPDLKAPPLLEQHILDYKVEHDNQEIVIEGVCKGDENDVGCWKPNGEPDAKLTTDLRKMITTQSPFGGSQLKFNKKNRLLMVREITKIDNKQNPPQGLGLSSYATAPGSQYMSEGWDSLRTYSKMKDRFRADDPLDVHNVFIGWFDRATQTSSFKRQFVEVTSEHVVIPFKAGKFTAEGNEYDITQIKDMNVQPNTQGQTGSTLVRIRQTIVANPNTILNVLPANEKGVPYAGNNMQGDPIDLKEYDRLMNQWQLDIQEAQKPGADHTKPAPGQPQIGYLAWLVIDPYQGFPNSANQAQIGLSPNKIKKFFVQIFHRRAISLDNIHLDPK
jgi:hypothetical protein